MLRSRRQDLARAKVTETGRAAVPLPAAAFEQGPASDCGPPDACGVTSKVSPRPEGEVLHKGGNAAYPSASSPRGEGHAEEQEAGSSKSKSKKGRRKKNPAGAPALVGGVSVRHKVTETGRAAVPLPAAAFEQGPASGCGPPDACGVTSKVSPRPEGEVLRKSGNAAYPSASSPCGEGHAEEQEAGSSTSKSKKGRRKKNPAGAPALVLVGGVSVRHKVTETGRAAVPLPAATFEQGPASDCGPPDARGVTSKVSPRPEGEVLHKGGNAAYPSASSPRGEGHAEEQEAGSSKSKSKKGRRKKNPAGAPALVGGVSVRHKVTETGRAAVPLPAAAFEQGPASDCGPPDACGVTSKVSPRSEGEVLHKGGNTAYPSASSPCGEGHAEQQETAHYVFANIPV
ncbi:collagen alpha-2(I) chain-like [Rhipicephalus sanguineus]|uniref:collagen alpha-2(I) chain-like n=1 Tax=Rhipicephalus sanguineus TaxID=34632 RepID=UPI0020C26501|nr:collagen alpha-2(I) chain-like [Rhipicephalus sanguineus]